MLAIHNIGSQPLLQGVDGSGLRPETGELDFFSYFLGLQVDPLAAMQSNEGEVNLSSLMAKGKEGEVGDEVLRSLFEKKETPPWEIAMMGNSAVQDVGVLKDPMEGLKSLDQAMATPDFTDARLTKGLDARDSALRANSDFRSEKLSEEFVHQLGQLNQANGLVTQNLSTERIIERYQALGNASAQEVSETANSRRAEGLASNSQVSQIPTGHIAEKGLGEARWSKQEGIGSLEKRKSISSQVNDLGIDGMISSNGAKGNGGAARIGTAESKGTERLDNAPEIFGKVQTLVYNGGGKMTVSLSPAHLGEVQIQVTTRGNKVEIEMASENNSAKSILESSLGDLVQSIEAQDLVVSKMEVHVGRELETSTQQGSLFAGGGNSNQFQQGWSNHTEARQLWTGNDSMKSVRMPSVESAAPSMTARVATAGTGRVDLRV